MIDNIAAIASGSGIGAIALIRVSGDSCVAEVSKVFSKDLTKIEANKAVVGNICHNNEIIDQVVITVYKAPHSYTGEDAVEITTHGGIIIRQQVLETLLTQNIKLASPGEFSKRAYLNGKIDLIQAEAIQELIMAESNFAVSITRNGLLKKQIKSLNLILDDLLNIITKIEVNIDYPEYEDENIYYKDLLLEDTKKIIEKLSRLTKNSNKTVLLTKGIDCAIIGLPNSGKSSLLNRLAQAKKAIVSEIAGTTRDLVETRINIDGVLINLVDTAGIRNTRDTIEKLGVKLAIGQVKKSKLVIIVIDASKALCTDAQNLIKLTENQNRIIVLNKSDKPCVVNTKNIPGPSLAISCKTGKGISELKKMMLQAFELDSIKSEDLENLFSHRQVEKVIKATKYLTDAKLTLESGESVELISTSLMQGYQELLEIIGKQYDSNLEKNLFSKFCLGK